MSLSACVHAAITAALFAVPASQPRADAPGSPDPIDFDRDVKPIFAKHCTSCHGPALMGQLQVPRLAGQDLDYLVKRLRGYKAKTTSDLDGMMTMVAQSLSDEDVENLVHFLASMPAER